MSDCVIGIAGRDFVLMAADATAAFSIILMKDSEDKILKLDHNKLLAACGENGDRVQFTEYIQKNLNLYRLKNDRALSTHAAANFLRHELATALRSRNSYQTNLLLGGFDDDGENNNGDGGENNGGEKAQLYFIDYLSSMQKVPYGAHGYGSYFTLSIMDKYYKRDMTVNEALGLLKKCINEIQTRLLLNTPQFIVKIVDKNGAREIALDNAVDLDAPQQQQQQQQTETMED